ncbi:MAG: sulfite exporter TauE/SafE family protein [Nitratireductor sp.]|nr:sulfite exporter TauE/SafE family protein [Nitratireductor sp.]MCB1454739.1 sulfite exporter TauE/SafE family protein [Nitratireductor sp.]
MPIDMYFYGLAIPAVMITGLSKGGFGGGIAMLGTPLLALAVSPVKAAAIMLPVLIFMDVIGLVSYRGNARWSVFRQMLPGAIAGIALGWATAAWVDDNMIRILVGAIAISFALNQIFADWKKLGARAENRIAAGLWGIVTGFTSFVSHAGGPPFQAYVLPLKLDKVQFAGTGIVLFSVINAVKVAPYLALGQFSTENLYLSATLLPIALLGVLAGVWLVRRVSQDVFYKITYAAMIIVGTRLVHTGVTALL